eukprot:GHVO01013020.1.p1 GENE.GHVO01013020.1~~GHVO01013020.1.p1  ORF type:complete len:276 (-),score=20.11 GHVO01013020.1:451-1278(-)
MIPHDVPARPWHTLGMDFFEWNGKRYLLVADYFSKFPIIRHMQTTTSTNTISKLKTIFGEYGVPQRIFTDQGPQFTSAEFKQFASKYQFEIRHSTPRYPQSNGFAEAMVKTVKHIMSRAQESGNDISLAMLIYRSTPFKPGIASPAELLNQRKYKDLIPLKQRLSGTQESSRETLLANKDQSVKYYDDRAKEREELEELQKVWFQKLPQSTWEPGTIVNVEEEPRSYTVQDNAGAQYNRNQKFVRPAAVPSATPTVTRSGRVSRPPKRYGDPMHK